LPFLRGFSLAESMALYLYRLGRQQNKTIMKNSNQTTVILKALDMELKALLENDLKNFKSANNKNNQAAGKQLMAA
jgi:hypothetical protein